MPRNIENQNNTSFLEELQRLVPPCGLERYRGSVCLHVCAQVYLTFWDPWTVTSLSMEFSRQEFWSGLSFPGDLPNPGIKPASLESLALAGDFFTIAPPGDIYQILLAQLLELWRRQMDFEE